MMGIKNLSVSSGSACTSASLEPSYVLRALGVEEEMAHTSLRIGLGRFTTEHEVDTAVDELVRHVTKLRTSCSGDGPGRDRPEVDPMGGPRLHARPLWGAAPRFEESVMAYSEKLIDHYENPRNIGSLTTT